MRILAFNSGIHDASAAIFEDYRLIAAVHEERLRRDKGWGKGVPWLAIDEVLRIAGWNRRDVDAIACTRGWFPVQYTKLPLGRRLRFALYESMGRERVVRDIANECFRAKTADTHQVFRAERFLHEHGFRTDIPMRFANHHEAHALTALFFTDWDDALIYTSDGVGDNVSYSMRHFRNGALECFYGDDRHIAAPRTAASLASAYGFATVACGFKMLRHEGKLTGLAAYGEPTIAEPLANLFTVKDGIVHAPFTDWRELERAVLDICRGHKREDIAASIQKVAEDHCATSVRYWIERTGARRLGLAGGLFANVRLNRLLAETMPLDEIFIFPAMSDDGLAVGAGLSFLLERDGLAAWLPHRRRLDDMYLGGGFDGAIDAQLAATPGIKALPGDPAEVATELICGGKAGAIYSARMEFGPRALGARSIIGSPADFGINDSLNKRLDRSEFMPFAPYVLAEDAERVFEITDVNRYAARFMTITCAVRPEWREKIPAVVHVDGTARPQIVDDATNPLYADILRRFRARTGLPVLINTSFNVHEEPIVNRPSECIRALLDDRVDFVVTTQGVYVRG